MLAEKQLRIYPNPVQTELTISISRYQTSIQGEYLLYSLGGAILKKGKIEAETTRINMSNYQSGTYLLKISIDNQTTSWKIIKQ